MLVHITTSDVEATAALFTALALASAAAIRWARTPTKEKLATLERQVGEIYTFLIKN